MQAYKSKCIFESILVEIAYTGIVEEHVSITYGDYNKRSRCTVAHQPNLFLEPLRHQFLHDKYGRPLPKQPISLINHMTYIMVVVLCYITQQLYNMNMML